MTWSCRMCSKLRKALQAIELFEEIWGEKDLKQQSWQGRQFSSLTQVTIGQYLHDVCHNKLVESHQCGRDRNRTSGFVAF